MSRTPARFAVGVVLSLGIAVSALLFIAIVLSSARHQEQPMYDIAAALACAAFYVVLMRGPLGKAIHGMLDSSDDDGALLEQGNLIDELMERATQDRLHLQELEERVEFAERLLAHQPEVQLPAQRTPV
jgi:hypothetical protein